MTSSTAIKTEMFQMRVSEGFLLDLDRWRAKQMPIPSRAEAVRLLVEKALRGK